MSDTDGQNTATAGTVPGAPPAAPGRSPADSPLQQLRAWIGKNPLILMLGGAAAVIAIIVALLLWAGGPTYHVLYSNLSNADGGRIISALQQQNVPYRFAAGGHAIMVPQDKVYSLRMKLAEEGLPRAGNVGFAIMDKQPFGISQFAEHINYLRGLQGELSNSIEALNPVSSAKVNLALPKDSVFVRDRRPAKASVILTLRPGRVLSRAQVAAITHMVSSSVGGLSSDAVTVVDQSGHLLSQHNDVAGLDDTQLGYLHKVEKNYQQAILAILTPILGADNVHAQVTAQIDFNKRETTSEQYGPNQGKNPQAVLSHQTSASWANGAGGPSGVPGALTNTPPGGAASPINNAAPANNGQNTAANGANTDTAATGTNPPANGTARTEKTTDNGSGQTSSTTNYQVDHNITHIKYHEGGVDRLSVAVVVNDREVKQKDGSFKAVPLDKATMAQITDLARQAMGFSATRGDTLEVVNSAFVAPPASTQPTSHWWQQISWSTLLPRLGRYLLILFILWLLYRMVLKPLRQRYQEQAAERAAVAAPGPTPEPAGGDDEEPAQPPLRPRTHRKNATYEAALRDLKEQAKSDPEMVAMIIRSWVKEDGK